jgi:hypothetical protein
MERKLSKREERSSEAVYLKEIDFVAIAGVFGRGPDTVKGKNENVFLLL